MDPTFKQKIEILQEKGELLQKQSKYKEALDVYEEVLDLNNNLYGSQSEQSQRISIKICELCNLISMILLQKQKFDLCLMFLKKAHAYCQKDPKYAAVTYNNYACYYRKTGKLRTALQYLQEALELQWTSKKQDTIADTYLNLCAVLSQLGRHTQALQNVLFSVTILQEQLLIQSPIKLQRVPVLAIAYHNMGVELQYLKRFQQAISAYEKAVKFSQKHLKQDNGLVQNLKNVLNNAIETKQSIKNKDRRNNGPDKDKVVKMKSLYGERPMTGKSVGRKPQSAFRR